MPGSGLGSGHIVNQKKKGKVLTLTELYILVGRKTGIGQVNTQIHGIILVTDAKRKTELGDGMGTGRRDGRAEIGRLPVKGQTANT